MKKTVDINKNIQYIIDIKNKTAQHRGDTVARDKIMTDLKKMSYDELLNYENLCDKNNDWETLRAVLDEELTRPECPIKRPKWDDYVLNAYTN